MTTPEGVDAPAPLVEALAQARSHGFLGDGPLDAQFDHSFDLAECVEAFVPEGTFRNGPTATPFRFLDLGTGGGVPGLVLAHCWPSAQGTLLDANERRTHFLAEATGSLGWEGRIQVVRARAEVAGRNPELRGTFDLVVARSFGPPPVTAECGAPFLKPGGLLVVSEPPASDSAGEGGDGDEKRPSDDVRWPASGVAIVGLTPLTAWRHRFGYQVLQLVNPVADTYPRREGVPAKRPLYRVPRDT